MQGHAYFYRGMSNVDDWLQSVILGPIGNRSFGIQWPTLCVVSTDGVCILHLIRVGCSHFSSSNAYVGTFISCG